MNEELWSILHRHGLPVAVALIAILALLGVGRRLGDRLVQLVTRPAGARRAEVARRLLSWCLRLLALIAFGSVIIKEAGVDITPLLTGAGIFGVAFGLGAQSLLKDLVNGFFILIEDQFVVGDAVELAGKSGVVEAINLRTTVLKGADGSVHVIPNSQITVASRLPGRPAAR